MGAHAERPRPLVDTHPPEEDRGGQEEAGHQPPAAFREWRDVQPVGRRRRLEGQPGELPDELHRIPVHRGQHVQPDDLEGDEPADDRGQADGAKIEGTDLGGADEAEQHRGPGTAAAELVAGLQDRADIKRAFDVGAVEEVLVFDAECGAIIEH